MAFEGGTMILDHDFDYDEYHNYNKEWLTNAPINDITRYAIACANRALGEGIISRESYFEFHDSLILY